MNSKTGNVQDMYLGCPISGTADPLGTNYIHVHQPNEEPIKVVMTANEQPFKCPVCQGRGQVPHDFYSLNRNTTSDISNKQCKSCNGTGIIWG